MDKAPKVGIIMGSDSDLETMEEAAAVLKEFGVPYEMTVASAHRTPARACEYASTARERGLKVIIAGAGMAAEQATEILRPEEINKGNIPAEKSSKLAGKNKAEGKENKYGRIYDN